MASFRLSLLAAAFAASLAACSSGSGSANSAANSAGTAGQAAGAAGAAAPAGAPNGYGGGGGRGRRLGQMLKELNLSDDQKAQIKQIVADARKQSEGADPQTRRANMLAAYDKIENSVLTPTQKVAFEKKRAEMRAKYAQTSPSPQ